MWDLTPITILFSRCSETGHLVTTLRKKAIQWGWELLTKVWKLPKERLYVTVYKPGEGDPAEFDQEAYDIWAGVLQADGLDPETHIIFGGKKDNFWMMGDTGPCGPCSEVHIDLTEKGDTQGNLVNQDSAFCMEIWNLVFIQFNATPNGEFFATCCKACGHRNGSGTRSRDLCNHQESNRIRKSFHPTTTVTCLQTCLLKPRSFVGRYMKQQFQPPSRNLSEQELTDIRMRALADHLRAVCFAIGDGILPGNEGRNYVIRHILRRGILAAQKLGMKSGDFTKMVNPLIGKMGPVFPELEERKETD